MFIHLKKTSIFLGKNGIGRTKMLNDISNIFNQKLLNRRKIDRFKSLENRQV